MTESRADVPPDDPTWAAEFTDIYDSHRRRLVRWLTAIFGARDAEDIAQEALTRLYVRPGLLAGDADAWPWLSVVARNVGRDLVRHNAFSTPVDAASLDQLPADAGVHDQVAARDDAERLGHALRRIPPRDRTLLHLRDVDGVPVGDIAERLGMNDNAVRQQLFRARKRLANAYVEAGGERRGERRGERGQERRAERRGGLALAVARVRNLTQAANRAANRASVPHRPPSSGATLSAAGPAVGGIVGSLLLASLAGSGGPLRPPRPDADSTAPAVPPATPGPHALDSAAPGSATSGVARPAEPARPGCPVAADRPPALTGA